VPVPRQEFDAEYIRRLVSEDPETEQHFTRYFGELLTLKLRNRLRSRSAVEDARQETFVRVLRTLKERGGLDNPGSLGAYVNSVCNNVLLETYRADKRTSPLDEQYDPAEDRPSADASLLRNEEGERVREALASLPEREQRLLRWLFFDERDKDDICREMQIDRNYLRVMLHRAKNQFKQCLGAVQSR
jgi:RNA polymerase sigma-70 factor (ECF subfamily)